MIGNWCASGGCYIGIPCHRIESLHFLERLLDELACSPSSYDLTGLATKSTKLFFFRWSAFLHKDSSTRDTLASVRPGFSLDCRPIAVGVREERWHLTYGSILARLQLLGLSKIRGTLVQMVSILVRTSFRPKLSRASGERMFVLESCSSSKGPLVTKSRL